MQLPKHKASLHLTHNQHKAYYEDIEQYIGDRGIKQSEWANETSMQRAIDTDSLWELQWYPDTPVGFYIIYGATLEEVLQKAKETHNA